MKIMRNFFVSMFGSDNNLFNLLLLFSTFDYISGVCVAIHQKKLSSKIGYKGITKKIMTFILVAVCCLIDQYLGGYTETLYVICVMFYIANELISIIENATAMGIPIPSQIHNALQSLKAHKK